MQFQEVLNTLRTVDGVQGLYRFTVQGGWVNGRTVYGGMQQAVAIAAMQALLDNEGAGELPLRSLQTNFVAPVAEGELDVQVAILRRGKSVVQCEARILQVGATACMFTACFGAARQSQANHCIPETPKAKPAAEAVEFPYIEGIVPECMKNYEARLAFGAMPCTGEEALEDWIYGRYREPTEINLPALVALSDVIPAPVLSSFNGPAPASSMTSTVEIYETETPLSDTDFVLFQVKTLKANNGYASHDALMWTPNGELLGLSHQTVVVFG